MAGTYAGAANEYTWNGVVILQEKEKALQGVQQQRDFPWLFFEVDGRRYAVNSAYVSGIMIIPEHVEPLVDAPAAIRGIFNLRGSVVPLMDLRRELGLPTLVEEYQGFTEMLERRKQDHLDWVEQLKSCVQNKEPFPLATDPHKCKFGRWYDAFSTPLHSVGHHMQKIKTPHEQLHRAATEYEQCVENHADEKLETLCGEIISRVQQEYLPAIVGLLDGAKEVFKASFREMVITLEDEGGRQMGMVVDEVLAVGPLGEDCGAQGMDQYHRSELITGVCRDKESEKLVLLLDSEKLLGILAPCEPAS